MFNLTRNHQKGKNTTPEGHVPAWHSCPGIHVLAFMSCCTLKAGAAAVKIKFLTVQIDIQQRDDHPKGSQRTAGMAGQLIRLINGKAVCSTLLNRITNSKVSIPTSSSSTVTHKGVVSSGSMAPCRSHHGYHTRQNWIFEEIHQELSPLTCKSDGKQINLRSIRIIEVLQKYHRDQNRHQIEGKPNIERIVEVNFRLRQPCKIDISISGVLGLAPCHSRKLQKAGTSR